MPVAWAKAIQRRNHLRFTEGQSVHALNEQVIQGEYSLRLPSEPLSTVGGSFDLGDLRVAARSSKFCPGRCSSMSEQGANPPTRTVGCLPFFHTSTGVLITFRMSSREKLLAVTDASPTVGPRAPSYGFWSMVGLIFCLNDREVSEELPVGTRLEGPEGWSPGPAIPPSAALPPPVACRT
eukprot:2156763-Rhodomonas_salina.6